MYKETQWLCNEIADFFVKENCVVYDLGCSTGTYLKSLASRHKSKKQVTFYGVDVVKQMINFAKKKNYSKNIKYLHKDIIKLKCNHEYHKECIKAWFDINKNCPQCRKNII